MKILVRGTNWIGDAVMSIPALRELRRIFPDARITLHTRSWADELFSEAAFIDDLVTYEKHKWVIKDVLDNSEFLKADEYDLALILPNSFESAVTSYLSRIPRRVGYNKDVRGLLLTDPIAVPEWKHRRHEVFYYLNLVAELERRVNGRSTVDLDFPPPCDLEISNERRAAAGKSLTEAGVDFAKQTIAFVAGSANDPEKRWPVQNFANLADELASVLDANIILLGSKNEADVSASLVSASSAQIIDLTGRTSLGEAAAILSVVDASVSNDTGLAHVSAAVGTPTAVIFGPTKPDLTRPFSPLATILQGDGGDAWPTVEMVFEATSQSLKDEILEEVRDETAGYIS